MFDETGLMNNANEKFDFIKHLIFIKNSSNNWYPCLMKMFDAFALAIRVTSKVLHLWLYPDVTLHYVTNCDFIQWIYSLLWLHIECTKKQSIADGLQNGCSYKFCKLHRKTPVLEPLFIKVLGLKAWNFIKKRLQHRCFPVKSVKFLRTPLLQNTSGGCFCVYLHTLINYA